MHTIAGFNVPITIQSKGRVSQDREFRVFRTSISTLILGEGEEFRTKGQCDSVTTAMASGEGEEAKPGRGRHVNFDAHRRKRPSFESERYIC